MRKKTTSQGLTLQVIAGTYVVLLGFNMDEADWDGLMGFAIHRTDHHEEEAYWMEGLKTFEETDPGLRRALNTQLASTRSKGSLGRTSRPSRGTTTPTGCSR